MAAGIRTAEIPGPTCSPQFRPQFPIPKLSARLVLHVTVAFEFPIKLHASTFVSLRPPLSIHIAALVQNMPFAIDTISDLSDPFAEALD